MHRHLSCHRMSRAALSAVLLLAAAAPVQAYTPEHPRVQAMVDRALKFLNEHANPEDGYYGQLGGMTLVGMAVLKHTGDPNHKLVQAAVGKCQQVARAGVPWTLDNNNYSVGIAIIFLCELDPQQYRPEIEALHGALLRRQQPGGGWSYSDHETGDTSQTQYAVLSSWMVHRRAKIDVPQAAMEKVCNWLIRTQAPNGSWGYQGKDPHSYQRIEQDQETRSLHAAGLSSVYVCAEFLGFIRSGSEQEQRRGTGRPNALRPASDGERESRGPTTDVVENAMLKRTMADGNRWFAQRYSIKADSVYQHYYMYALERYMSFRELAEGGEEEPRWYNDGVDFLAGSQADDGSWRSCEAGPVVDTAFAVLFLLRSTGRSISKMVEEMGVVRGGKGIPENLSNIAVDPRTGQVVDQNETPAIDVLLSELETSDDELNTSLPDQLTLSKDPQKRRAELARLRRMAMSGTYQARITAVKTLAKDRDIGNVPVLIYALSDGDWRIRRAARDGLRFISRDFDGFGMPDKAERSEWLAAQRQWKRWYLSIRPDGALIE